MISQISRSDYQKIKEILADALELESTERAGFLRAACAGDERLLLEAESLLAGSDRSVCFLEEFSAARVVQNSINDNCAAFGEQIGNYRIERELGRGGMGVVYLAAREDFHQQVAIKLIKKGMDSDAILERFTEERKILAALNHPYIARLTDGGTTVGNTPFFVMEYVEGIPIDDYCKNNKLSKKELLELFRKICQSISFAHQKLIVHRDLKPSNILVTGDGTPKLLDFGVAKLLNDAATNETRTGMRAFTPAYASPEQIKGEPIDTTSDVYSLGVVLYELLTKAKPYKFDSRRPDEIARIICESAPLKPSAAINLEIENQPSDIGNSISRKVLLGDLDNIVLKALQKEPGRRYASVEQFSEDIRRHLEGLPVIARKDTARYRLAKFIKRHQVGTASALLILIILLGGIMATGWEAHRALIAQERSERRFDDVRQLSNSMLFELNDEIEKGPTAARVMLVKKASEYLDKLNRESDGDASLKLELITAYIKVGDLQGRPYAPNLGDLPTALESYQKAGDLAGSLVQSDPLNPVFIRKSADVRQRVGEIHIVQADRAAARQDFTQLIKLREKVLSLDPQNSDYRREQADAEMRIGDVLGLGFSKEESVDFPAVIEYYQQALTVFEDLAEKEPNYCSRDRFSAASVEQRIGLALIRRSEKDKNINQRREAFNHYSHVVSVIEKFAAAEPDNQNYQRVLAGVRGSLAEAQANLGDYDAALGNYRQIEILTKTAANRDKANIETRINLASLYLTYADALEKSGDNRQAAEKRRLAVEVSESVLSNAGTRVKDVYGNLLDGYFKLALEAERSKDFQSSSNYYRKSLEYCERMLAVDSENQDLLQKKAFLLTKLK